MWISLRTLSLSLLLTIFITPAMAAINVWPINPFIVDNQSATLLWLDNAKKENKQYQVRVFRWEQRDGQDIYQEQKDVQATPPIVDFSDTTKQAIRLMRLSRDTPVAGEQAYRIILDELPSPQQNDGSDAGIRFRMRLVLPFFIYGNTIDAATIPGVSGVPEKLPPIHWKIVERQGVSYLEIHNKGSVHLRLVNVFFSQSGPQTPHYKLSSGLLGYVLPGQVMRFPLKNWHFGQAGNLKLYSYVDDKQARLLSNE